MNNPYSFWKYVKELNKDCQEHFEAINEWEHIQNYISKIHSMVKFEGLPETINEYHLKNLLFLGGFAFITEYNGKPYAFTGGLGGELDENYFPTIINVNNPYLKLSKEYTIKDDKDGVLIKNTSTMLSFLPIFQQYAQLQKESDTTLRMYNIMTRLSFIITSSTSDLDTVNKFIKDVVNGELKSVATDPDLFNGENLNILNANVQANGDFSNLIEYNNYIESKLFMKLGIPSSYNMKRERLISSEIDNDILSLLPLIDDLVKNWSEGFERVNEKYGTNISIELNSAWKYLREQTEEQNDGLENDEEISEGENEDFNNELEDIEEKEEKEEEENDEEN